MRRKVSNISSLDREEERQNILQNFSKFRSLVDQAKVFARHSDYNMAAIYADMADEYASWMAHCGLFVSPELEHLLLTVGQKALRSKPHFCRSDSISNMPMKILHITYGVWDIGGHSRLLWRWIQADSRRSHSVVLTRMAVTDAPKVLRDVVLNSNGKIYALNETAGNFIARAEQLREIAASADIVVMHTGYDSSIPIMAFSNKEQSPPIIYVNHADERFWIGVFTSDVVMNLRESGMHLSEHRRGIEARRNTILPTILETAQRSLSRSEAKLLLGIDRNNIVILSIARAAKYKTSDGGSFADIHVPLLQKYKQAVLIVIGSGNKEDWSEAIQKADGRIKVFGETPDTALFYQAADIYIDSYPFVSITSLLEAGSYGLPLVSRYPYSSALCEIFGADMPGLTGNLIRVHDDEEYIAVLSQLINDKEFRLVLGEATRKQIEQIHMGTNWKQALENIYVRAVTEHRLSITSDLSSSTLDLEDKVFTGEPDIFLQEVCPFELSLDKLISDRVRLMPFNERFSFWLNQIRTGDFGRLYNLGFLLPDWIYRRMLKLAKF